MCLYMHLHKLLCIVCSCIHGASGIGSCEPPDKGAGSYTRLLEEQQVFLATKPALQPLFGVW